MNWRSTSRVLGSRAGAVNFRSNTAEQRGFGGGSGLSPFAKAFITAIETDSNPTILTTIQKNAINDLVKDLLAINTVQTNFFRPDSVADSVLKVFYPFVADNVDANKYNLLNPVNTDAANRLSIAGTVDFTNGFKSNGTTGYANTFLNYSAFKTNNVCWGFYKNESTINSTVKTLTGIISGTYIMYPRWLNNDLLAANSLAGVEKTIAIKNATELGLFINNYRTDKSQLICGDSIIDGAATAELTFPSRNVFIGATNSSGNPNYYVPDNICCFFQGTAFSDAVIPFFKLAIYKYQRAINRTKRVFYFNGDSITQWYNANPQSNRFSTVLSIACNAKEVNNAIAGEMMCNYLTGAPGHNFYDRITANSGNNSLIDYYNDADSLVFLNHGVNEISVDNFNITTSLTQWEYVIDFIHTTRKWPYGNIVLTGPFVKTNADISAQQNYNQALKALAEGKGCIYVNVFDALYGTTGYIDTDNIHLTNAGHQFTSDLVYSKLQSIGKL